jgi:hypothetical protein
MLVIVKIERQAIWRKTHYGNFYKFVLFPMPPPILRLFALSAFPIPRSFAFRAR